jgi:hypothetical protein
MYPLLNLPTIDEQLYSKLKRNDTITPKNKHDLLDAENKLVAALVNGKHTPASKDTANLLAQLQAQNKLQVHHAVVDTRAPVLNTVPPSKPDEEKVAQPHKELKVGDLLHKACVHCNATAGELSHNPACGRTRTYPHNNYSAAFPKGNGVSKFQHIVEMAKEKNRQQQRKSLINTTLHAPTTPVQPGSNMLQIVSAVRKGANKFLELTGKRRTTPTRPAPGTIYSIVPRPVIGPVKHRSKSARSSTSSDSTHRRRARRKAKEIKKHVNKVARENEFLRQKLAQQRHATPAGPAFTPQEHDEFVKQLDRDFKRELRAKEQKHQIEKAAKPYGEQLRKWTTKARDKVQEREATPTGSVSHVASWVKEQQKQAPKSKPHNSSQAQGKKVVDGESLKGFFGRAPSRAMSDKLKRRNDRMLEKMREEMNHTAIVHKR